MDTLREERQRGVTIEWSLWSLTSERHEVDIVDTPGHASFVKNMAVGSSLADAVVVVLSAVKVRLHFLCVCVCVGVRASHAANGPRTGRV